MLRRAAVRRVDILTKEDYKQEMGSAPFKNVRRKPMQHLKKCPVCNKHDGVFVMEMKVDAGTKWERAFTQIRCKYCNVSTEYFEGIDGEIRANDAWNRREKITCDTTIKR
jgi:transcription elongation factor Elf1